jgi:hypothetical protein
VDKWLDTQCVSPTAGSGSIHRLTELQRQSTVKDDDVAGTETETENKTKTARPYAKC